MVSRLTVTITILAFLNTLFGCSSNVRMSVAEAERLKESHTPEGKITGLQLVSGDEVTFDGRRGHFDDRTRDFVGYALDGQWLVTPANNVHKVKLALSTQRAESTTVLFARTYAHYCEKGETVITRAVLNTNQKIKFAKPGARLFPEFGLVNGQAEDSAMVTLATQDVQHLYVRRDSRTKTALAVVGITFGAFIALLAIGSAVDPGDPGFNFVGGGGSDF